MCTPNPRAKLPRFSSFQIEPSRPHRDLPRQHWPPASHSFHSIRTTPRHLRHLLPIATFPPCVISLANPARDLERGLLLPFGTLALPASHNQARTLLRRIRPLHELVVDKHHSNVFLLQSLLTMQAGCTELVVT